MVPMRNRFILLPRDFSSTPDRDLGAFASEQKKLLLKKISVPKIAVIPLNTLKSIASANSIPEKISKVLVETNFKDPVACTKLKKTIHDAITRAKIPHEILQELGETYHSYFSGEKVNVFTSNSTPYTKTNTISGDANVFSSLLEHWAESTTEAVFRSNSKHIHPPLLSNSIVIQEVVTPTAHGVLYTKNPKTGTKTSIVILSNPTHKSRHDASECEEYEVDVRTWNIISQPHGRENAKGHSLNKNRVIELAKIGNTIKKQHLEHKLIHWDLVRNEIVISFMEDFHLSHTHHADTKTMTKLYVSAGNPQRAREYTDLAISGIGYLKSEYTILSLGTHPSAVIQSGRKKLLVRSLEKTLTTFCSVPSVTHVIYKAFDVPSDDLSRFRHATSYESDEKNAWLGVRGAGKQLIQPEILQAEIEALKTVSTKKPCRLSLLLPFVRSASELHRLLRLIQPHTLKQAGIETWVQIATPEPLLSIENYPLEEIDGISIQVDTLANLVTGISPTHEYRSEYTVEAKTLKKLLKPFSDSIRNTAHKDIPIHLQMEQYNPEYTKLAVELGFDAVTTRPAVAPIAKACIMDTEAAPFRASSSTTQTTKL